MKVIHFFFRSCPSFLDEPREETLATQATINIAWQPIIGSHIFRKICISIQKKGFIFIFTHWILILHFILIKYKHYYIYEMYYNCQWNSGLCVTKLRKKIWTLKWLNGRCLVQFPALFISLLFYNLQIARFLSILSNTVKFSMTITAIFIQVFSVMIEILLINLKWQIQDRGCFQFLL